MKNLFYLLLATSVLTEQSIHGEAPKKNKKAKNKSKGKSKKNAKSINNKKLSGKSNSINTSTINAQKTEKTNEEKKIISQEDLDKKILKIGTETQKKIYLLHKEIRANISGITLNKKAKDEIFERIENIIEPIIKDIEDKKIVDIIQLDQKIKNEIKYIEQIIKDIEDKKIVDNIQLDQKIKNEIKYIKEKNLITFMLNLINIIKEYNNNILQLNIPNSLKIIEEQSKEKSEKENLEILSLLPKEHDDSKNTTKEKEIKYLIKNIQNGKDFKDFLYKVIEISTEKKIPGQRDERLSKDKFNKLENLLKENLIKKNKQEVNEKILFNKTILDILKIKFQEDTILNAINKTVSSIEDTKTKDEIFLSEDKINLIKQNKEKKESDKKKRT